MVKITVGGKYIANRKQNKNGTIGQVDNSDSDFRLFHVKNFGLLRCLNVEYNENEIVECDLVADTDTIILSALESLADIDFKAMCIIESNNEKVGAFIVREDDIIENFENMTTLHIKKRGYSIKPSNLFGCMEPVKVWSLQDFADIWNSGLEYLTEKELNTAFEKMSSGAINNGNYLEFLFSGIVQDITDVDKRKKKRNDVESGKGFLIDVGIDEPLELKCCLTKHIVPLLKISGLDEKTDGISTGNVLKTEDIIK